MEEVLSKIDYQNCNLRLKLLIPRVKILLRRQEVSEILEKLVSWCQISASSEQMSQLLSSVQPKISRSESEDTRKSSKAKIEAITSAFCDWIMLQKPQINRTKPQAELNLLSYMLILHNLIRDYRYFSKVLQKYESKNLIIQDRVNNLSKKHKKLWAKVKYNSSISLESLEINYEDVRKEILLIISHTKMVKSYDSQNKFDSGLCDIENFYEKQLSTLKNISKKEQIINLYEKKLLKALRASKYPSKISYYREKLLRKYLKNVSFSENVLSQQSEIQLLEQIKDSCEKSLSDIRFTLIKLWTDMNPSLQEIVEKRYTSPSKALPLNTEQFDRILDSVISRMNLRISNAKGLDFLKFHDLARKYVNFKEKRLTAYTNLTMKMDFFINVLQNVVWDYEETVKDPSLVSRYSILLNLVQGEPVSYSKFFDEVLSIELASVLAHKIDPQIDLSETKAQILSGQETELIYLTKLIVESWDLNTYSGEEIAELFVNKLKDIKNSSLASEYAELLGMNEPSPSKTEEIPIDIGNEIPTLKLDLSPVIPSETITPKKVMSYKTDSFRALNGIFRFYSNQKCQNSEEKSFSYMNSEQFHMFCKDFNLCQESKEKIEFVFSSKVYMNELQFISAVELLASFAINADISVKEKHKTMLKQMGCFDLSYVNMLVGTSRILESPLKSHALFLGSEIKSERNYVFMSGVGRKDKFKMLSSRDHLSTGKTNLKYSKSRANIKLSKID